MSFTDMSVIEMLAFAVLSPLLPACLLYTSYRSFSRKNEYGPFLGFLQGLSGISILIFGLEKSIDEKAYLLIVVGSIMTVSYICIFFALKKAYKKFNTWLKDDPYLIKNKFIESICGWALIPLLLSLVYVFLFTSFYENASIKMQSSTIYKWISPGTGLPILAIISLLIMVYGFIKSRKKYIDNKNILEIKKSLATRDTQDLLNILIKNDKLEWPEETFTVIQEILKERGKDIPHQEANIDAECTSLRKIRNQRGEDIPYHNVTTKTGDVSIKPKASYGTDNKNKLNVTKLDEKLVNSIQKHLEGKTFDELSEIYAKHDTVEWSDEAFEAIRRISATRGEPLPAVELPNERDEYR